jgi:hypothetical protein
MWADIDEAFRIGAGLTIMGNPSVRRNPVLIKVSELPKRINPAVSGPVPDYRTEPPL